MNNRIAFAFVLLIIAFFAVDAFFFDGEAPLFLARQFVSFVEYLSFWR